LQDAGARHRGADPGGGPDPYRDRRGGGGRWGAAGCAPPDRQELIMMPTTLAPPATHVAGMLQTLMAADRFRTFIAAVAAAGVSRDLSRGGLTVFAPSDYAFERLPVETLTGLFTDRDRLRAFLAAHIVRGEYAERDLIPFTRLPTLAGNALTLSVGRD